MDLLYDIRMLVVDYMSISHNACVWWTDRRTDRQISTEDRVCALAVAQ